MKKVIVILSLVFTGLVYAEFDSLNMRFVGNWPFGPANSVACDSARNLAFLGSGGGVFIVDVSNSTEPTMLSDAIRTQGVVNELYYDESSRLLYVALVLAYGGGLEIWDINDAYNPVKKSFYDTYEPTYSVWISGRFAYLGCANGLDIVDVFNPVNPQKIGHDYSLGQIDDVCVSGHYAYLASYQEDLVVEDVSNRSTPHKVGSYPLENTRINDLCVSADYVYLATGLGLEVIDVSLPFNPKLAGSLDYTWGCSCLYVSGSYAYLGAYVIDISDPSQPEEIGYALGVGSRDVRVCGAHAYVAGVSSVESIEGLCVIDVSTPETPELVGTFETPGQSIALAVSKNRAYLMSNKYADAWSVIILDIEDRSKPGEIGQFPFKNRYDTKIGVRDSLVFVSGYSPTPPASGRFLVIDAGQPSEPKEIGACEVNWQARDMEIGGSYVYLATTDSLVRIMDVGVPHSPFELGSFDTPGSAQGLHLSGAYLYVADGDSGLCIVDVSDPQNPKVAGALHSGYAAQDVCVSGSFAYLACRNGLYVADVSSSSDPVEVGYYASASNFVAISSTHAYLAKLPNNVFDVLDLSNPINPVHLGYQQMPGRIRDMRIQSKYLYAAIEDAGMQVYEDLDVAVAEESERSTVYLSTSINRLAYELEGKARFALYSVDGRKVLEETLEGKEVWEAPRTLAQGVYFFKISNGPEYGKGKIVVLR